MKVDAALRGRGPEDLELWSDGDDLELQLSDLGPLMLDVLERLGMRPARAAARAAITTPRWMQWRGLPTPWARTALRAVPDPALWQHLLGVTGEPASGALLPATSPTANANLLDVAIELTRRELRHCRLCSWRCGVDRTRAAAAHCGSGATARITRTLDSVGDEPALGQQFVVWLAGCNWQCPFCQWPAELNPRAGALLRPRRLAEAMDAAFDRGRDTLHIVGGNPDQHAAAMLRMLRYAQQPLRLAWDANASATGVLLSLVPADLWVLDLRAGNEACAVTLGGAPGSWSATRAAIRRASVQPDAQTIVRHLVVPGHVQCCTAPVLAWLQAARAEGCQFELSLGCSYVPRHRALTTPGLDRRPTRAEIADARELVRASGLPLAQELTDDWASQTTAPHAAGGVITQEEAS